MRKVLVTGGTIFVSRSIAEHFVEKGDEVYVLNRNHHIQPEGVRLIESDRHKLGDRLKKIPFDLVIDATSYTKEDTAALVEALGTYKEYVFISSSAVYPETGKQPFRELEPVGRNRYWGDYGVGKYEAEQYLIEHVPNAFIIRPPYLYGPMNDVYREAFVFDCAEKDRPFFLPKDGSLPLQFFYIHDLCVMIDLLIEKQPKERIFNVGNETTVTVKEWVTLCYKILGKVPEFKEVHTNENVRNYFCFAEYPYYLEIEKQKALGLSTTPLEEGLRQSYEWYQGHKNEVERRPYMEYSMSNL